MVFPCSGVKKGRMEGVLPVADDSVREEKDGLLFWFFLLANLLIFEGFTWYWSAFSTSSLSIESAFECVYSPGLTFVLVSVVLR